MNRLFNNKITIQPLAIFIVAIFVIGTFSAVIVKAQENLPPAGVFGESDFAKEAKEKVLIKQQQGESIEETEAEKTIRESQERDLQKQSVKLFQGKTTEQNKEFVPLAPIPGIIDAGTAKEPSKFFNAMFNFGIIIAGFLAVIMIAIGGIQYMSTDAISGKTAGREKITYALMGLLLILFSYILLKTINPDILQFNLFN